MKKERTGMHLLVASVCFAIVSIVLFGFSDTFNVAGAYEQRVHDAAVNLERQFKVIEDSAKLSIMEKKYPTDQELAADIKKLKIVTQKSHTAIGELQASATNLDYYVHPIFIGAYSRAESLQQKVNSVATQSQTAIDSYEKAIRFIEIYVLSRQMYETEIDTFNRITDFDRYAGQGAVMRNSETKIRSAAARLAGSKNTPFDTMSLKSDIIKIMNQTADGFRSMANGLDAAREPGIYGAVAAIEAAGTEFDRLDTLLQQMIQDSRTLKDVYELREKLEPLKNG